MRMLRKPSEKKKKEKKKGGSILRQKDRDRSQSETRPSWLYALKNAPSPLFLILTFFWAVCIFMDIF